MSHHKQFHANPDLFADPYLNVNKQFLSSLATCPNQHLAGCAGSASTPHQVTKTSSDVFHTQPPAQSIPLAKQPVQENFQNGNGEYLKIGDQEFDTNGIIAPSKLGWNHPVVSPPGTEWLGTRYYANPTLAQMNGQIQWASAHQ